MTPSKTARPSRGRAAVAAGILAGLALAGLLVARFLIPQGPALGWHLGYLPDRLYFDARYAQDVTVLPVMVPWFDCDTETRHGFMPTYVMPDPDWLHPEITYTPVWVTVTLRVDPAYYAMECASDEARHENARQVSVQLQEPLGDRTLLDGSVFPPAARTHTEDTIQSPAAAPGFDAHDGGAIVGWLRLDDPIMLFVWFMILVVLWEVRWVVPWGLRKLGR